MVLIALLLVALVCIVIGIVTATGAWFVASLVLSAVAGYLLWRRRDSLAGRSAAPAPAGQPGGTASRQTSLVTGTAFAGLADAAPAAGPAAGAAQGPVPPSSDRNVWVVDGRPDFHAEGCDRIAGADSEPVPLAQAREDGFTECAACAPTAAPVAGALAEAASVWVVDGRPEYHLDGCTDVGADGEQIPRSQAVEDGFIPCVVCKPDDARPAAGPPADPGTVWVVDGRPRYHLADCLTIKDQDAEPIPVEQAEEDGFMPCSMCEPAAARV